jgi:hypothetical protein
MTTATGPGPPSRFEPGSDALTWQLARCRTARGNAYGASGGHPGR